MKAFLKELEQKLQTTSVKNRELSEHIVKLNGYFENMPTMEEYQGIKEHVCSYTIDRSHSLLYRLYYTCIYSILVVIMTYTVTPVGVSI